MLGKQSAGISCGLIDLDTSIRGKYQTIPQTEINEFLIDCFNDEDPKVFIGALNHLVKKHGVADIAETIGVNRESLYKSFNGKVSPRWDTVKKVMKVLNVEITHAA